MKYSEVVANPTIENIQAFVLEKLYFQGQPVSDGFFERKKSGHGYARSALGYLLPTAVIKKLSATAKRQEIRALLQEHNPAALGIFTFANEPVIRKLQKLSQTKPSEGTAFRSLVQEYPGFVPFYKK
jgi:hypothetical protein